MSLNHHHIEMLAREHLHRPTSSDALMIGRRSVYLSADELIETLHGIDVSGADAAKVELDRNTLNRADSRGHHPPSLPRSRTNL